MHAHQGFIKIGKKNSSLRLNPNALKLKVKFNRTVVSW